MTSCAAPPSQAPSQRWSSTSLICRAQPRAPPSRRWSSESTAVRPSMVVHRPMEMSSPTGRMLVRTQAAHRSSESVIVPRPMENVVVDGLSLTTTIAGVRVAARRLRHHTLSRCRPGAGNARADRCVRPSGAAVHRPAHRTQADGELECRRRWLQPHYDGCHGETAPASAKPQACSVPTQCGLTR